MNTRRNLLHMVVTVMLLNSFLPSAQTVSTATHTVNDQDFGKLPLYFVENQGPMDERVASYIQGQRQDPLLLRPTA